MKDLFGLSVSRGSDGVVRGLAQGSERRFFTPIFNPFSGKGTIPRNRQIESWLRALGSFDAQVCVRVLLSLNLSFNI